MLRLAEVRPDQRSFDLLDELPRPELDDRVRLCLARRADKVDDTACLAAAGRSVTGTSSATDSRSASSSLVISSSGTSLSMRGTSSVVQSTISGSGCTSTVAENVHAS